MVAFRHQMKPLTFVRKEGAMNLIVGAVFIAAAVAAFLYSVPRGQKAAAFVGTEWEAYVVVLMIVGLCFGIIITISGVVDLAK
jgi:hypothetical protein